MRQIEICSRRNTLPIENAMGMAGGGAFDPLPIVQNTLRISIVIIKSIALDFAASSIVAKWPARRLAGRWMNFQRGGTVNTFFAFILGVLAGWLIEWVIDFFYWRQRAAGRDAYPSPIRTSSRRAATPIASRSGTTVRADDLKVIKGIGMVIEGKLNAVGIYTFEQLGRLTTLELRQILGSAIERLFDEDSLLEQARQLARRKA
jgi:predicted flap endonuclease-1-like 5' DNA nuclease